MPDDLRFARELAKRADVNLHEIFISPNLAEMLPQMVRTLDEPIGDGAAINAYLICKGARDLGIKVLLSGMGADEMFAGYRRHYACMLAAGYRRLPAFLRSGLIEPLMDLLPGGGARRGYRTLRWAKRFTKFASLPEEQAFHRSYAFMGRDDLASALNKDLTREVERVFGHHDGIYAQGPADDQVNRMCSGGHATVSSRPQSRLHRPRVDGGIDRGARAVRRHRGRSRRISHRRKRQDRRK